MKRFFEIENLKSSEGLRIFNYENEISTCEESVKRQALEKNLLVHKADMLYKVRRLQSQASEIGRKGNDAIAALFKRYNAVYQKLVLKSINK